MPCVWCGLLSLQTWLAQLQQSWRSLPALASSREQHSFVRAVEACIAVVRREKLAAELTKKSKGKPPLPGSKPATAAAAAAAAAASASAAAVAAAAAAAAAASAPGAASAAPSAVGTAQSLERGAEASESNDIVVDDVFGEDGGLLGGAASAPPLEFTTDPTPGSDGGTVMRTFLLELLRLEMPAIHNHLSSLATAITACRDNADATADADAAAASGGGVGGVGGTCMRVCGWVWKYVFGVVYVYDSNLRTHESRKSILGAVKAR